MNLASWAVLGALVLGSLRALLLFRLSTGVEAVNAVVLATLASGRGRDLGGVLGGSAVLYASVARSICEPLDKLWESDRQALRRRLERDAHAAIVGAQRALGRFAWLDALSLAAIVLAGVSALTGVVPTAKVAVGLLAATLLWLSNLYGARGVSRRIAAGAFALVDSLVTGAEEIRKANGEAVAPVPGRSREPDGKRR